MSHEQPSLEQYVSARYMESIQNFQPSCLETEEVLRDTMDALAMMNKVSQGLRQRFMGGQAEAC